VARGLMASTPLTRPFMARFTREGGVSRGAGVSTVALWAMGKEVAKWMKRFCSS
jgi:hypothetical protein